MNTLLMEEVIHSIKRALEEDQVSNDLTSQACFPNPSYASAQMILKQNARIAGLILLPLIAEEVDPKIEVELHVSEGDDCSTGTLLSTWKGNIRSLLAMERVALNFVQHASGIATTTARYAEAIKEFPCELLDTRKTLPGLRSLEKYAVVMGGGTNHRFDLSDQILVKDNHISHLKRETKKPIHEALKRAHALSSGKRIQIEVSNLDELKEAIAGNPDAILLDNMPHNEVKEAVKISPKHIYLEASGGIHLGNIKSYAEAGVQGISIGRLTHSTEAVDISLKI